MLLAAIVGVSACSPSLERDSGTVVVTVDHAPSELREIRLVLMAQGESYRVVTPSDRFDGRLTVESVPWGEVGVRIEAETGIDVVVREQPLVVRGSLTEVTVDLGNERPQGPTASVDSSPIAIVIQGLRRGSSESTVSGSEQGNRDGLYRQFLASAAERFGREPSAISVKSALLELEPSSDARRLGDLWSGPVSLSFRADSHVVPIGSTSAALDGTSSAIAVTADRSSLAPVREGLLSGEFELRVEGRGQDELREEVSADVRVIVVYSAWRP